MKSYQVWIWLNAPSDTSWTCTKNGEGRKLCKRIVHVENSQENKYYINMFFDRMFFLRLIYEGLAVFCIFLFSVEHWTETEAKQVKVE